MVRGEPDKEVGFASATTSCENGASFCRGGMFGTFWLGGGSDRGSSHEVLGEVGEDGDSYGKQVLLLEPFDDFRKQCGCWRNCCCCCCPELGACRKREK